MKRYYSVSYRHSDSVYCANIAHAETEQAVTDHYRAKSDWVNVKEASDSEVRTAQRKGMPIVEI